MELTKQEIEIADRYISKRERQLAQWPLKRWLILAIFSVFMVIGYRNVSDGTQSIREDETTDLAVDRALGDGPPPGEERRWVIGAMMKMGKLLELRHQVVTYSLIQIAVGFMTLLSGVIMVCLTLLRWNIGERDALICKLLRAKLQELEQTASPSNSQPPLSPASLESSEIKTL
jgi:hypothetical protein